jgi:hypothetical protein
VGRWWPRPGDRGVRWFFDIANTHKEDSMGLLAQVSDPWGVIGRLLEEDLNGFDGRPPASRRTAAWPAWDLFETPDTFIVVADMPGFDNDAISVAVRDADRAGNVPPQRAVVRALREGPDAPDADRLGGGHGRGQERRPHDQAAQGADRSGATGPGAVAVAAGLLMTTLASGHAAVLLDEVDADAHAEPR